MKVRIFFTPWTSYWDPEDIIGYREDGLPITKEGSQPYTHTGWNACYKMTVNGKQYGCWICWAESKDGFFPPELRGSAFYKNAPKMLYAQAKKDYEEIMRGNL